jgi:hypothetical protein
MEGFGLHKSIKYGYYSTKIGQFKYKVVKINRVKLD